MLREVGTYSSVSSSMQNDCTFRLWVSNRVDPGAPEPGEGSGLGEEVTKEKGWCVHSSNLPVAISFLRWLTFQPSACLHWGNY